MRLPKSITVCGKTYKVRLRKNMKDKKFPTVWGRICISKGIIEIDPRLAPDQKKETLLHECLHALSDHMDLKLSEKQVTQLSKGLFSFLKESRYQV